jgi:hypothetical protein
MLIISKWSTQRENATDVVRVFVSHAEGLVRFDVE